MGASYFSFFLVLGLTLPFLTPVLLDLGYSKEQVGFMHSGFYLCTTVAPILFGRFTDRYTTSERMMRHLSLLLLVLALAIWGIANLAGILLVVLLLGFHFARGPMVSLQDAIALQVAGNRARAYGRMRLMGSVGFGVSAVVGGWLLEWQGNRLFFPSLVFCCLLLFVSSVFLPKDKEEKAATQGPAGFWSRLDRSFWIWLVALMLHWLSFGPFNYGFTLLLHEVGTSNALVGWIWLIGIVAEVGFFLIGGRLFARFSARRLLEVALLANLVRWALLGLFPSVAMAAITQLLHGPGFALFYAAALHQIADFSGGTYRASYQGLFSTCVGGISSILGTGLAGWLHDRMSFSDVLLFVLPFQFFALVILLFHRRYPSFNASEAARGGAS